VPFPGNLGAIATGVSAVLSGIASAKSALTAAPALASGGLAFGETLATVGDNPNAATNPEVIAPLDKLRGMMGGEQSINITVNGEIQGDKLKMLLDKVSRSRGLTA